jgi:hypothetical protein
MKYRSSRITDLISFRSRSKSADFAQVLNCPFLFELNRASTCNWTADYASLHTKSRWHREREGRRRDESKIHGRWKDATHFNQGCSDTVVHRPSTGAKQRSTQQYALTIVDDCESIRSKQ